MKAVIYTMTDSGVLVPVEEGVTQADVQQAYDVGYSFGQLAGYRQAYAEMERVVEERRGLFETTAEDVQTAKRRILH